MTETNRIREGKSIRKSKSIQCILLALSCIFLLFLCRHATAKVYIDITSPAFTKFPIAVFDLPGESGTLISGTIRNDLDFTGLFKTIDTVAFLEKASQPFDPKNWTPLGVDAVVKGSVKEHGKLTVTISLFDVVDGKEIFRKEYAAAKDLIRPLAHTIANDIYTTLTGEQGMFRSKIAFVGNNEKGRNIYIMDWDGHRMTKTGLRGNIILAPRWSQAVSKLVYSAEKNRQWGIYLLDFQTMTEKKIYASPGTHIVGDFLPKSNKIVLSSSKKGTPDLYIMDLAQSTFSQLTSGQGIEVSPAVSPDGNYIAFVSDKGGSPQIYIMQSNGSNTRRLTYEGSYNTSPCWSPKGDKIVFSGRKGANQVFTINPDGTGLTQLTQFGNNEDPSFSPDGLYVTFCSDRDGSKGIYIMRENGEAQQRITPQDMKASAPRWSPD